MIGPLANLFGYGHEDFRERLAVIEDEGDDRPAIEKFTAQIVAIFDYMLVSESEGDPARIASAMREIGMPDSAAIVEKLTK
jgi:hypothetical protein